ncbi:MAG: FAD binding domain-containing protein [Nitrospinota bacterium]
MALPPFSLHDAKSVQDACRMLTDYGDEAIPVAGGTAVLILMKSGLYRPAHLVNLMALQGLSGIRFDPKGGLHLGALATHRAVERHPAVCEHYPVIAQTYARVANVRVRNSATVGGNLAHGDFRIDPPAPLIALGARIHLQGPGGERALPLEDFFTGFYTTAKEQGEIVTAVTVPPPEAGMKGAYLKYVGNAAADWPTLGTAVLLKTSNGKCEDLRVVLTAVAERPVKVRGLEKLASGQELNEERIEQVAQTAASQTQPIEDQRGSAWYKREMVKVHVRRAIESLLASG